MVNKKNFAILSFLLASISSIAAYSPKVDQGQPGPLASPWPVIQVSPAPLPSNAAQETGGNLDSIKTSTSSSAVSNSSTATNTSSTATNTSAINGKILTGQQNMSSSIAVVLPSNQSIIPVQPSDGVNVAHVSPYNYLRTVGEGTPLLYDDFDGALDTKQWSSSTTGTASITPSNSFLILSTNVTSGNAASITSVPTFPRGRWGFVQLGFAIQLESGAALSNVDRTWGLGDKTDGILFELLNSTLKATIYQGGVQIHATNLSAPTDGQIHSYVILTRVDQTYWFIDGYQVPIDSVQYVNPNVATLPISLSIVNTGTPTGPPIFDIMSVGAQSSDNSNIALSDIRYPWMTARVTTGGALQVDASATAQPVVFWNDPANASLDAFKALRISSPLPLWDAKNIYDMSPLLIDNILTGGATATYLQNQASVQMNLTNVSGDKFTRRSRQWIKYHPGSSQLIKVTGLLGAAKANVSQRMGYFDDHNGLYLEQTIAGLSVCRRTYTSNSVVNNCTAQSSWNLDKLDGTGPSGKTLTDGSKDLILAIDFQWLSYGKIRWMIDFGDKLVPIHWVSGVNNLTVPTFSTPDLPITWEIENTAATASATSMYAVCASVHSEGGSELQGYKYSATNGTTITSVTTRRPILTIRPKATFGGITNRATVWPLRATALNTAGGNVFCEVIYNGALTGTPSWTSVSSNSVTEYDTAYTGISGGELIDVFGLSGTTTSSEELDTKQPLTLSADASTQDTLSIVCTNLTGTTNVKGFLQFKEWR